MEIRGDQSKSLSAIALLQVFEFRRRCTQEGQSARDKRSYRSCRIHLVSCDKKTKFAFIHAKTVRHAIDRRLHLPEGYGSRPSNPMSTLCFSRILGCISPKISQDSPANRTPWSRLSTTKVKFCFSKVVVTHGGTAVMAHWRTRAAPRGLPAIRHRPGPFIRLRPRHLVLGQQISKTDEPPDGQSHLEFPSNPGSALGGDFSLIALARDLCPPRPGLAWCPA